MLEGLSNIYDFELSIKWKCHLKDEHPKNIFEKILFLDKMDSQNKNRTRSYSRLIQDLINFYVENPIN